MAILPWINYTDKMVGKGHPSLPDTLNNPLRSLLTNSGINPDATTIGLLGPLVTTKGFGCIADGIVDDTIAFQAAVTAAQNTLLPLYVSPGSYNLTSAVQVSGNYFRWMQPQNAILQDNAPNGPAVLFSGAQMQHLTVDGLRVKAVASKHRTPGIQFGDVGQSLNRFAVRDVFYDGNNVFGDGIKIVNCFEGSFSDVFFFGQGGGIGFDIACPDLNSGNINFRNCMATTTPILFLVQENKNNSSLNLMNSLHFDNCKLARLSTISTNKFFAGTSAGVVSIGATTILLTGGQGVNYAAGDWIVVSSISGNKIWADKVASVATDTLTLTATAGLPFALAANDPVVVGNWMTVLGTATRNATFTDPHWERCNGVLGSGAHNVTLLNAFFNIDIFRGIYLVNNCQGWKLDGVAQGGVNPSSTAIVFHQANDVNNNRNCLSGIQKITGLTTWYQADGGSTLALKDHLGGTNTLLGVWHQDTTVAANQTDVQLTGPNGSTARSLRLRTKGAVIQLTAQVSTGRSAGTLTAKVFKNGSATTVTAVIDGTSTFFTKSTEQVNDASMVTFNSGDILDVRVTTDGTWAPTANNLDCAIYVST